MPAWLLMLIACTQAAPEPVRPPDVLVVVLDTVRADRLATYGHHRDTSYPLTEIALSPQMIEALQALGYVSQ